MFISRSSGVSAPAWRRYAEDWPAGSPNPRQWLIHDGGGMASAPWDLKAQAAALMPAPPKPHPAPSAPPLLLFPAKPWHAPRL